MTVLGRMLGLTGMTKHARSVHTGCEGTEWGSETSLRCLVGSRGHGTTGMTLTSGERVGSISEAYSVDDGTMSTMREGNQAGTGSTSVTVLGGRLGHTGMSGKGRSGETGCEGTEWGSETSLRCQAVCGRGVGLRMALTAGVRAGTRSWGISVDVGGVCLTRRSNTVGTGSISVTVHGSGFGSMSLTTKARGGSTGCEGTGWESETSVRCMSVQSSRGTLSVVMTSGGRDGSGTEAFSSDVVGISIMRSNNKAGRRLMSVMRHGGGLEPCTTTTLRSGSTLCEMTEWRSETALVCVVGQWGAGTLHVVITTGKGLGSMSEAWSSDRESMSMVHEVNRAGRRPRPLTVFGHFSVFGSSAFGRFGFSSCECTGWMSVSSLFCKIGTNYESTNRMVVTFFERTGSISETVSMDNGVFHSMHVCNSARTGSVALSMQWSGPRHHMLTSYTRSGASTCEMTIWVADTSLQCLSSAGAFETRLALITAGHQSSSTSGVFSMDTCLMSVLKEGNTPGTGALWTWAHGSGFVILDLTSKQSSGQTVCEGTEWRSETSLRCKRVLARGTSKPCAISISFGLGSLSNALSYDLTIINGWMGDSNKPERPRQENFRNPMITGWFSNLNSISLSLRIGATSCEASSWASDSVVQCKLARSDVGSILAVAITSLCRTAGSVSKGFTIDAPSVSGAVGLISTNSPSLQGTFAMLQGRNFGM